MKTATAAILGLLIPGSTLNGAGPRPPTDHLARYAVIPLAFEANQGQADPSVRFLARGVGFPPRDTLNVMPLLKMELAVAGIAPGFKVRASGDFGMPGDEAFSLTCVYLVPKWR